MKIEKFVAKYIKLLEEETDPKLREVYRMVVHDANNVHALISAKEQLEAIQKGLIDKQGKSNG